MNEFELADFVCHIFGCFTDHYTFLIPDKIISKFTFVLMKFCQLSKILVCLCRYIDTYACYKAIAIYIALSAYRKALSKLMWSS